MPADPLAAALAVLVVDLLTVLPGGADRGVRERLANTLFERGLSDGGGEAAKLLGGVGATLMAMEV